MLFWSRVHFKGGERRGGGVKLSSFQVFPGWGGEASQKRVTSIFQGGPDTLEDTTVDFWKVIYENVEKNKHFTTSISIYTGFEVL